MTLALPLALAAELFTRSLTVSTTQMDAPIRLEVPAGAVTRIVLPEMALGVKYSPGAKARLGLRLLAAQPLGIVAVEPPRHPARGTVDFCGPKVHIVLDVETVGLGAPSEIHVSLKASPAGNSVAAPAVHGSASATRGAILDAPPTPPPSETRGPSQEGPRPPALEESGQPAALPSPQETALPWGFSREDAPAETSQGSDPLIRSAIDLPAFSTAEAARIDRTEGLLGQRRCVLAYVYAPKEPSDGRLWLKFRLVEGGADRLEGVTSSWGLVEKVKSTQVEKDLMILVQVPGEEARKKHAWVELRFSDAGRYHFSSLRSPSLSSSVKALLGLGHD